MGCQSSLNSALLLENSNSLEVSGPTNSVFEMLRLSPLWAYIHTSTHILTISKLLENWPLFDVVLGNFVKEGCGCNFVSCRGVELEGVG